MMLKKRQGITVLAGVIDCTAFGTTGRTSGNSAERYDDAIL